MASLKQFEDKLKMLSDFKKVVNIEKIVVMREIVELKKIITQLEFKDTLFNNLLIDLYKKHGTLSKGYFSNKTNRVPVQRDLWFVMASSDSGANNLNSYSNKLVLEYLKKNTKPEDVFVVIGRELVRSIKEENYDVISVIKNTRADSDRIYDSIAQQVIRGYKDLMFVSSKFIFFDISSRKINEIKLFPFDKKKRKVELKNDKDFMDEISILKGIKLGRSTWLRDINDVSTKIARFAIREKSYYVVTQYKLDSKLRELQSLDDKEKNIETEAENVRIKMQRVRQEGVTNELLTNAVAFSVINDEEASDG